MPSRDFDVAKLKDLDRNEDLGYWKAERTGKEHLSVAALSEDEAKAGGGYEKALQFMLSKAMIDPAPDSMHLLSKLKGVRLAGEYLFIARPLIYGLSCFLLCSTTDSAVPQLVLAIQKYGSSSYKPWTLSIFLELLAMSCSFDVHTMTLNSEMTILDKETLSDRTTLLFYYLLRSPFYDSFSK